MNVKIALQLNHPKKGTVLCVGTGCMYVENSLSVCCTYSLSAFFFLIFYRLLLIQCHKTERKCADAKKTKTDNNLCALCTLFNTMPTHRNSISSNPTRYKWWWALSLCFNVYIRQHNKCTFLRFSLGKSRQLYARWMQQFGFGVDFASFHWSSSVVFFFFARLGFKITVKSEPIWMCASVLCFRYQSSLACSL